MVVSNRREFLKTLLASLLGTALVPCLPSEALSWSKLVLPIPRRPPKKPKVSLIIDDIGNDPFVVMELLHLGIPITFSILPWRPYSLALCQEIQQRGHEIMLHQPMEPMRRDLDPGPGALFVSSSPKDIALTIERNLGQLPTVAGVNNHMGSRFTSRYPKVRAALEVIKSHGLFFVDSVTTSHTVAYRTARALRMHAAHMDLFLDHVPSMDFTTRQLKRLEQRALKRGHAIAIGHPFPSTVEALKRYLDNTDPEEGPVEFVYVSSLL